MAGDLLMAELLCSTVIKVHNGISEAFILRARVRLEKGDFEAARVDVIDALARDSENATAFCLIGEVLNRLGDYENAQRAFAQAVAITPSDTQILDKWARSAADYNDFETALECYEKAAELEPESSFWPYCTGCMRNRMKDWESAEEQLAIAIERNGAVPGYYTQRALTYLRTGRPELAMADYLKAEELDPSAPSIQAVIAQVAFSLEDFDFALKKYDEAIGKGEETFENYHNRAMTKSRLGMTMAAIEDVSRSIAIQPTSESFYQRSRMYNELRDLESAIRDIDTVIEFDPTASHPYQVRAALYRDLGQDERAREDDAKALQLS
jgi:tetratricopeptide (TPR) repeat protein